MKFQPETSKFCSNNYNKTATITSGAARSIARHHPHQHQSKEATHRRTMRIRSSMVAGSGSCSRSASIAHGHRRSFRYTRTLDIILEEQHSTPNENRLRRSSLERDEDDATVPCTTSDNGFSCASTDVAPTDFWHSMRGMKKSTTSASLDSLLVNVNESDDRSSVCATNQLPKLVEDDSDDYDNFFDVWEWWKTLVATDASREARSHRGRRHKTHFETKLWEGLSNFWKSIQHTHIF